MESSLRVVLIDSREERRHLMIGVVEGDGDRAVVVAEADGAESAEIAVRDGRADAVLVDVWMPVAEGLRTIRRLRATFPALGVVVCSFDLDPDTVGQALAAGAGACLPKPASPHEVVAALVAARRPAPAELATIA